jgi:hypothetical protein
MRGSPDPASEKQSLLAGSHVISPDSGGVFLLGLVSGADYAFDLLRLRPFGPGSKGGGMTGESVRYSFTSRSGA